MTIFDFIFATLVLIVVAILIISWIGTKYDIVGRDAEIDKLKLEIKKMEERDARRKKRNRQKKKASQRGGL